MFYIIQQKTAYEMRISDWSSDGCSSDLENRRESGGDDLGTLIATGQIDGRPISDFETMSYYIIVATAGHDTTSSSTAGALWALAEHPKELATVKADPSLIPSLVDESLRWVTPLTPFMRSANSAVVFAGSPRQPGAYVVDCYTRVTRDEARVEVHGEDDRR